MTPSNSDGRLNPGRQIEGPLNTSRSLDEADPMLSSELSFSNSNRHPDEQYVSAPQICGASLEIAP